MQENKLQFHINAILDYFGNIVQDVDISLDSGINILVGPSGAGKSTFIKFMTNICDSEEWKYGSAPGEMFETIPSGIVFSTFFLMNESAGGKTSFGNYVRRLSEFSELTDAQTKAKFQLWADEWIRNASKYKKDKVLQDFEWSETSRMLNHAFMDYLKQEYRIENCGDLLLNNGSQGEKSRLSIALGLEPHDLKFCFFDESFSPLDRSTMNYVLGKIISKRDSYDQAPVIVISSHQLDLIENLSQHNPGSKLNFVAFRRNKKPQTHKLSLTEDRETIIKLMM